VVVVEGCDLPWLMCDGVRAKVRTETLCLLLYCHPQSQAPVLFPVGKELGYRSGEVPARQKESGRCVCVCVCAMVCVRWCVCASLVAQ
jgi:hypothetical protein